MRPALRRTLGVCLFIAALAATIWLLMRGHTIALLQPKGEVALKQRNLLLFSALLSLVVVVPVFILTAFIAVRYREGNKKASYTPNRDGSRTLEAIWWCIPLILILILSVVTWQSSHSLDPYKQLQSSQRPVKIQAVAMDWKWLFLYPDDRIALVNQLYIPVGRPINFELTSQGPMNSFWIPQLGGQVYAMSGMSTKLHLAADTPGVYQGQSSNISGDGFSDMKFQTYAVPDTEYAAWVQKTQQPQRMLDEKTFADLKKPSQNNVPLAYSFYTEDFFTALMHETMGMEAPAPVKEGM